MERELKQFIDQTMAKGATYVDARWYPFEESNSLVMWNGNLKALNASSESGVGVRVLYRGAWGFSASSSIGNLGDIFDKAYDNARVAAERVTFPVRLAEKDALYASFSSPNAIDPFAVPMADKVAFLQQMDAALNQPGVIQRITAVEFVKKKIIFLDSEGSQIEKTIIDVFPMIMVMGMDKDGGMQRRKFRAGRLGKTRGWETLDTEFFTAQAERIVRELNELLVAEDCPKDQRSVILLPGIMFLQTHETIGHALELDRILGYELAFAGGSFVRLEDFGNLRYGSPKLTVRADAT
ncbi:MAG TPA: DNA gyrase modulator, partial [Anaerolineaceae bacterium]|nr:DNA gyrase modulator [Anaerolineaceae bacterium]